MSNLLLSLLVLGGFLAWTAEVQVQAAGSARAPIHVDGQLTEPAWQQAPVLRAFGFPWSLRAPPRTEFRALADEECLYFAFDASDGEVMVEDGFNSESVVDREDRVELFFAKDAGLERYYCLEVDPLGRVHDYAASHYRQFDSAWNCPGLRTKGLRYPGGYTIEGRIPLRSLAELLGREVAAGSTLRLGLFRAEFRPGALGDAADNWLSWVQPAVNHPDFHVPSAFTDWRIPRHAAEKSAFRTRGVVVLPSDLSLADWPERAARAGLTTVALHDGVSPKRVADFIASPSGRQFLAQCAVLGLHVEYELHAMAELLPRDRFKAEPHLFRMNEKGERTPDANLCVHSEQALEIVAINALRMAQQLSPTTSRYFFWGDDGLPWCRCPKCRDYSDSDQALLLENHLLRHLRAWDPNAELAHLAYANTLQPPRRVRPEAGIFLEFAPIHRRYDLPYAQQTGAEARDALRILEANLETFPAVQAQVLEYWLDVSRFSGWKRPAVELPWRPEVLAADLKTYRQLGIRNVTTFAAWIDAEYDARFGAARLIQEYGERFKD